MATPGNLVPLRSTLDVWVAEGLFTGAAGANMSTVYSKGIVSVNYASATGKFTITFQDVGGDLIDVEARVHDSTGTDPLVCQMVRGTFSSTAKTVSIEFSDLAGTLANPASSSKVYIACRFLRTA